MRQYLVEAPAGWTVSTVAGSADTGSADGTATKARFRNPRALALTAAAGFHARRHDDHLFDPLDSKGGILVAPDAASWREILSGGADMRFSIEPTQTGMALPCATRPGSTMER